MENFSRIWKNWIKQQGKYSKNKNFIAVEMKAKNKTYKRTFLILMLFVSLTAFSQKSNIINLRYQNETWKLWAIEAGGGALSFYGDVSAHDGDYLDKLIHESGPAVSVSLTRHLDRLFAVSGQLMIGQLSSSYNQSSFTAKLLEYNLNASFNLYNLFIPNNSGKFGITAQAGMGQFIYRSVKTDYMEGSNTLSNHSSRVPEFTYFLGAGSFVKTSDRFGIKMDISIRQCQTDWLDNIVKNDDFDYYAYLSFGVIYYFNNLKNRPVKNKARLAHNNLKLKHLTY